MTENGSTVSEKYLDYNFLDNGKGKQAVSLEFSLLSGYNLYRTSHGDDAETYMGVHSITDTPVRIMQIGMTDAPIAQADINWHRKVIEKTMPQEFFEWPIDLLEYQNSEQKYVQCYVFPLRAYPEFVSIKNLLYQDKNSERLDWRNEEIRDIIRNILTVFSDLYANGFSYNDFNMDRIFFDSKTKRIFLRHNHSIRLREEKKMDKSIDVEQIAIEFAPSYIYEDEEFVGEIDEYSISSLLFRLMIGRLPYEGRGLTAFGDVFDPIRDTDREQYMHEDYFKHYHEFPVFIFDLLDEDNSLGPMSENDLPKERWNELPSKIKEMFQNSLGHMQKEHREKLVLYSPGKWLEALDRWCWK